MAANTLNALQALDEALRQGWQFHVQGGEVNLVVVRIFKPDEAFVWTTIYGSGSILDVITQTGETLREVIQ